MEKEIRNLKADEIEVKVKQVGKDINGNGFALLLLYKTSRVDMAILDEIFGSTNWCDDYKDIKGNMYCGIGARESKDDEFVWKWDCGIESKDDEEGNQKKGEASDAFKRAGFKWGIGRELYTAPLIFISVDVVEDGKKFKLKDKFAKYSVKEITYKNDAKVIDKLIIVDKHGRQVFPKVNNNNQELPPPPPEQPKQPAISNELVEKRNAKLEEALSTSVLTRDDVKKWVKVKTKKDISPEFLDDSLFMELLSAIMNPKNQKPKEDDKTITETK